MKATELRLAKLEKQYEQSPLGVMIEVMEYLSQDPIFEAANARLLLAYPGYAESKPEFCQELSDALDGQVEVQPDDQEIYDEAFINLPDEYKEKLRAVGLEV